MRYVTIGDRLGSGQFGDVYKVVDVDSWKFMAVKILRRPARISEQGEWRKTLRHALKREVKTISQISLFSLLYI